MNSKYKSEIKAAKLGVLIYSAIIITYSAVSIVVHFLNESAAEGMRFASSFTMLIIPVCIYLFYKALSKNFQFNKLRLVPVSLVPLTVCIAAASIVSDVLKAFPFDGLFSNAYNPDTAVSFLTGAIGAVIGAIVSLAISGKLCTAYLDFFFENHTIAFQKEYGIKKKWWFPIPATFITGIATALLQTIVIQLTNDEALRNPINSIISSLGTAAEYVLMFAFLNVAFKNIDKITRQLFYPFVAVFPIISKVFAVISSAASAFSKNTFPSAFESTAQYITSAAPGAIVFFASAVLELIVYILISKKLLGAFEETM